MHGWNVHKAGNNQSALHIPSHIKDVHQGKRNMGKYSTLYQLENTIYGLFHNVDLSLQLH